MSRKPLDKALVRHVMDLLAMGMGPMEAARQTGVSKSAIYRMHHRVGGVYRPPTVTYSKRYLDREERYEIARLWDAGNTITDVAKMVGRSKSTVSRELNATQTPGLTGTSPKGRIDWPGKGNAGRRNRSCRSRGRCGRRCRKC